MCRNVPDAEFTKLSAAIDNTIEALWAESPATLAHVLKQMLQNSDSEHTSAATKFEKLTGSYTKSVRDLFPSDSFFRITPASTTRSRTARKRSAHKINTHVRTLKTVLNGAVEQPSAASTAVALRNEHTQLKATEDVVATFDMSLLEALLNGPADASCKDPSEEMSSQQSNAAEEDGQKSSGAEQTNDEATPDADDASEDVSEAEEEADEEENATEEEKETDEEEEEAEEEAEEESEKSDEANETPKSHLQKDQQNTQETDANEQRDKVEHGGAVVRQGLEEQDDDADMTLFDSSNDDTHMVGTQPHCSGLVLG